MEIRVNEYIRTKNGIIAKLEYISELNDYFFDRTMYQKYSDTIEFLQEYELDKYIVKHSFEPIDLIEVGDYVNGELMTQAKYDLFINSDFKAKYAEQIKSIVTKEMYESIKYEV